MRFYLFLFIILFTFQGKAQTFEKDLKKIVRSYDKKGKFNGIVLVGFSPENIHTFEFGYKDPLTRKEKISINDRFYLASIAKHFTGTALLQLIDSGLLHHNDTIGKWFPELKPNLRKVTVRQLANHTSGIPDFYDLTKNVDTLNNAKILRMLSLLDSTETIPGAKFNYCNAGYVLMAMLVERITNMNFTEYCEKNFFRELHMDNACFMPGDSVLCGFNSKLKKKTVTAKYYGPSGLYASGTDMLNYYKSNVFQVVKWNDYSTMAHQCLDTSNFSKQLYSYGWFYGKDEFDAYRFHPGDEFRFFNYFLMYENKNVMVCILSNKRDPFLNDMRKEIMELVKKEAGK